MATQGMVVITNGLTVTEKIVAGCDGRNAERLARKILEEPVIKGVDHLQQLAKQCHFGSEESLVIISKRKAPYARRAEAFIILFGNKSEVIFADSVGASESDFRLYIDTFDSWFFNPRWSCGLCEHVWLVDTNANAVFKVSVAMDKA